MANCYTDLLIRIPPVNQADLWVIKHLIKQKKTLQNKHFYFGHFFKKFLKQRKMIIDNQHIFKVMYQNIMWQEEVVLACPKSRINIKFHFQVKSINNLAKLISF